jgi:hypothetical protein
MFYFAAPRMNLAGVQTADQYAGAHEYGSSSQADRQRDINQKCNYFARKQGGYTLCAHLQSRVYWLEMDTHWVNVHLQRLTWDSKGVLQGVCLHIQAASSCCFSLPLEVQPVFITYYYPLSHQVVSQYSSLLAPIAVESVLSVIDPSRSDRVDLRDIKLVKKLGGTVSVVASISTCIKTSVLLASEQVLHASCFFGCRSIR